MNAMDCQLEQYAKDFQVLVGLHRDLEQRYDHLSTSHRQLAGASEVLRLMSPRSQVMCLVTNLQGDIAQATARAWALFAPPDNMPPSVLVRAMIFHLPRLAALLKTWQSGQTVGLDETAEIVLTTVSEKLYGEKFVTSPLLGIHASMDTMYWIVQELSKREQREFSLNPTGYRSMARRTGAIVFDTCGDVVATDAGFHDALGLDASDRGACKLSTFQSPGRASAKNSGEALDALRQAGQWQGEISSIGGQALAVRQWMSVSAIQDTGGQVTAYVAQLVNLEKMLMAERSLLDAHYHDPITGLPNRKYFKVQVAKKIADARQAGEHVALLSIQLDRRQWIRDTHDSAISDAVVIKMGERLLELTRGCDTLARADEDQFLLLLVGPHNDAEIAVIATQMIKALSEPVTIQHQVLQIGGSIGCALFPQDGADLPTLTKNAESTMRLARKAGGNRYGLFKHGAQPLRGVPPPQSVEPVVINQCDIPTTNMELGV